MLRELKPAFRMVLLMTIALGIIYPFAVTGLCQAFFHTAANGSLVRQNGQVIGSTLIAQNFVRPEYFHPRPSAAGTDGYDATASSGSNLGPTSQKLIDRIKSAAVQFRKENPDYSGPIPSDALTASGSGLDPDISVANAYAQAVRVAKARGVTVNSVNQLISSSIQDRGLGFLGEPRVNVLAINLALDREMQAK